MAATVLEEPVTAPSAEAEDIEKLNEALTLNEALSGKRFGILVSPDGDQLIIPETVYETMRSVVNLLAEGDSFQLVPLRKQLTTQQAADLLNMSRPHLIKLLEQKEIPFEYVGSHRRVAFDEVMKYKRTRAQARRKSFSRMSQIAKEAGDYN